MFFVSTPSLFIYVILAVFYLANLAVFAVSRQQKTTQLTEVVNTDQHIIRIQEPSILLYDEIHTQEQYNDDEIRINNADTWWIFDDRAAPPDDPAPTPLWTNVKESKQNIYYRLFSRPPPIIG